MEAGKEAPWRDRLKRLMVEYDRVQGEATVETLRRFRWVAAFMTPLFIGLAAWFGQYNAPIRQVEMQQWAGALARVQATAAVVSLLLWGLTHVSLRRSLRATGGAIALQVLICASYLLYGTAITLIDLTAGAAAGVTSYMMVTLLVGVLSLMRPAIAIPVFLIEGLVFNHSLSLVGLEDAQLRSLRVIAVTAPAIALFASVMIWHQYTKTVLLRRQLSNANKSLLEKQVELEFLAERDALTGLYNRRQFRHLAGMELARAARFPTPTSAMVIDIDFFKKINDRFGHPGGDDILVQVAKALAQGIRTTDVVARLGGEEFVVMLPNTDRTGAAALAEKLRASLCAQPLRISDDEVVVSASFGVTELPIGQSGTTDDIYEAADRALYFAKQNGRNRVEFAPIKRHA